MPNKKIIFSLLSVFLLVGAVAAGVSLVQRNQDIREKAVGEAATIQEFAESYACGAKTFTGTQQIMLTSFDIQMQDLGDAYSLESNRQAILGNNEPAYLDALLDAYKATNNDKYLQAFITHGDRVLGHRDDKAGYTDYRGRSAATWSNGYYSTGGQYASYLIEDGTLIGSLAHFAAIVKNATCLQNVKDAQGRTFDSIASTYIKAAGETVNFHHENWHTGTAKGFTIGYYTTPSDATFLSPEIAGKPVPINYQAAMGTALAYLYSATKNNQYLVHAQRIGNYILLEMADNYKASADAYTWPTWPQMTYWPGAGMAQYSSQEDLSHSVITAEFARAMHEQGLGVFYSTEMQRIAHTYSRLVYSTDTIPIYIDGAGGSAGSQVYQFGRVAMLSPYDSKLWNLVYDVMVRRLNTDRKGQLGSTGAFTGLARLISYYPTESPTALPSLSPSPSPSPSPNPTPSPSPSVSPTASASPEIKVGDMNGDGKVNILDYTLLFEYFGKDPSQKSEVDLNRDGQVNILDYTLLFENFGK